MGKQKFDFPFTKLPNDFVDQDLKNLSGSEVKVFLFILRKTVGWRKRTDVISYSQFKEFTGYSIPTIRKALENLELKGLINRYPYGKSYRYEISIKYLKKKVKRYSGNSLKKLHSNGKESFIETPKKFAPQKKKNIKLNTTNCSRTKFRDFGDISVEEVFEVIDEWNGSFNGKIDVEDENWINSIREILCFFNKKELKKAMQNRLTSQFYKKHHPYLLHKPKCFFAYLETIENDMKRESSAIYTYDEKADLIFLNGYDDKDFEIREDLTDEKGKPLWELKKTE